MTLNFGICKYKVKFVKKIDDEENENESNMNVLGNVDFKDRIINVVDVPSKYETIIHEYLHAWLAEYGYTSLTVNEPLVYCLTNSFLNLIRNNKDVIIKLMEVT